MMVGVRSGVVLLLAVVVAAGFVYARATPHRSGFASSDGHVYWQKRYPEFGGSDPYWVGFHLFGPLRIAWQSDHPIVRPGINELSSVLRQLIEC
jgi:hypothetical protein